MEQALMESGVFPVLEEHTGDSVYACVCVCVLAETFITEPQLPELRLSLSLPSMQGRE